MVLELKDKLFKPGELAPKQGAAPSVAHDEAISALEALGFRKKDAEKAVLSIINDDPSLETGAIIRKALSSLNPT